MQSMLKALTMTDADVLTFPPIVWVTRTGTDERGVR